jgi:hypothetical protein
MNCRLTQVAGDSASPQGKQRDFEQFGSEQKVFRHNSAERLNKPLAFPQIIFSLCR